MAHFGVCTCPMLITNSIQKSYLRNELSFSRNKASLIFQTRFHMLLAVNTGYIVILFGLVIALRPRKQFFSHVGTEPLLPGYLQMLLRAFKKCLAQGHYMGVVGLETWTSRSGVRHATTEQLRPPHCHSLRVTCSPNVIN